MNPDLRIQRLSASASGDAPTQVLSVPAQLKRAGMEVKLLIQGEASPACREPDPSLMLLGQARRFQELVMSGGGATIAELSARVGVSPSYFTRVLRLSFLAPEITKAILQGRQPPELRANTLIRACKLPSSWSVQQRHGATTLLPCSQRYHPLERAPGRGPERAQSRQRGLQTAPAGANHLGPGDTGVAQAGRGY